MRGKEVGLYRGNGMEDEGTLRSKILTIEWTPCVPTTLLTLGPACQFGHVSQETSRTVTSRVHLGEIMDPWSEGATEEYKIWR